MPDLPTPAESCDLLPSPAAPPLAADANVLHGACSASACSFEDLETQCIMRKAMQASEQRFHKIFTLSRDMLCVASFDGWFKELNPAWERTLGWSLEELSSQPFMEFVHPDDRAATLRETEQFANGHEPEAFENRLRCKDGSYKWLLWSVSVSVTEDLFYGVARDVTEKRRVYEQLRESEERFRTLVESASVAIVATDARGRIILVNGAAEKMFGYHRDEMLGESIELLVPVDLRTVHTRHRAHFVQDPHLRPMGPGSSFSACRKDGSTFPAEISLSHTRTTDGMVVLALILDITERRKIERIKDEFISVVSHELRTPLTSIRASLGLLASGLAGAVPEKAQRMLDIAVSNTDRLVRLINAILDIERLESGRVSLERKPCAIGPLLHQSMEVMQAMADREGITLVAHPIEGVVWADEEMVIQTVTNLISNAIKFSSAGGQVDLEVCENSGEFVFSVRDRGRGIPSDMLDAVFEHFHQVDASDSREKGGTGLGLAICRGIVHRHGGRIWVESALGQGSSFHFTLPSGAPPPEAAPPA